MFDTIIIGAGPSGLTAGIYSSRRMMKTIIISKNVGGQVAWASNIENYPGIQAITGPELAKRMQDQVKSFGVDIKSAEVKKIIKKDGLFTVETTRDKYIGKTIILAMGQDPKTLNLPNEKELTGRGISYCANCDGQFFKNKKVAVAGGGNAALDATEVMSKIASQVYLIYRKDKLKGFEILVSKVIGKKNVQILLNSEIIEISGKEKLTGIKVADKSTLKNTELEIDGLFVEIGHEPKTGWLAELVECNQRGEVVADSNGQTSVPGIFAAGDVAAGEFKQIIIGCGQGAAAALSAYKFIQSNKNFS